MNMDDYMEYRIACGYSRAFVTLKTASDISLSIIRRCRGALERDGTHQIVCQLSPLTKMLDWCETRYKND